jgi:CBS domain-containing protein
MKIEDVLPADLRSCDPGLELPRVAQLLRDHALTAVPVVDALRRPLGIVTERDVCQAVASGTAGGGAPTAGDVLGRAPSCRADESLHDALRLMATHRARRLVVVDREGELRGLLSVEDLVLYASDDAGFLDLPTRDVMAVLRILCLEEREQRRRLRPAA